MKNKTGFTGDVVRAQSKRGAFGLPSRGAVNPAQAGFTLIETLMYIALFALIMGGLLSAVYSLYESNDRNQTKSMLQEEKSFLIGKINYALDGASAVHITGPSVTITKYSGALVTIRLSGSDILYNDHILNNTNVQISNLVFLDSESGGTNQIESIEAGFTALAKTSNGLIISQIGSTTHYFRR